VVATVRKHLPLLSNSEEAAFLFVLFVCLFVCLFVVLVVVVVVLIS